MPQPLFNSLGSNYSLAFVLDAFQRLWSKNEESIGQLQKALQEKFGGTVFLFYKGRDAIEFAVRVVNPDSGENSKILTQAFTCHAIEEGIVRAGATPEYVDLGEGALNPTGVTLDVADKKSARAVLVQHTLGVLAETQTISKWCHQHKIPLIEDLAQGFGGQGVGAEADIIICSFGRDKIIDAVAGGAVIFKRPKDIEKAQQLYQQVASDLPAGVLQKDMSYPLLTWLIRQTHQYTVGKLLLYGAKLVGWLSSPVASPTKIMTKMPAAYAQLALRQLKHLEKQLAHRQKIALIYHQAFQTKNEAYRALVTTDQIQKNSNLRYPLWVAQPDKLAKKLVDQNIFVTDRWYRQPVDSGSLNQKTVYPLGSCPHAEQLAQHIINLPTHFGILQSDAERIAQAVKDLAHE